MSRSFRVLHHPFQFVNYGTAGDLLFPLLLNTLCIILFYFGCIWLFRQLKNWCADHSLKSWVVNDKWCSKTFRVGESWSDLDLNLDWQWYSIFRCSWPVPETGLQITEIDRDYLRCSTCMPVYHIPCLSNLVKRKFLSEWNHCSGMGIQRLRTGLRHVVAKTQETQEITVSSSSSLFNINATPRAQGLLFKGEKSMPGCFFTPTTWHTLQFTSPHLTVNIACPATFLGR